MRYFLPLILALLSAPCFAQLNIREINRNADILEDSEVDPIMFYSGESVKFNARLRRGNQTVTIPSDCVPVWRAWVDGTPNTLYISATGTIVNGYAQVELTPSQSNITAGDYKFQVSVSQSSGTLFGIAAQGDLEILFASPQSGVDYVGTVALWPTNIVDLADVSDSASPTLGAILYGSGTLWTKLAAGTSGYVLTTQGGAAPIWSAAAVGVSDGDKGDITVSASGATWNIDAGVVGPTELASTAVTPGSYGPVTATFDQQGRVTAAATSSSGAIQSALGAVYLPLAGGMMTGNLIFSNGSITLDDDIDAGTGHVTASQFNGSGAGLTTLNASNLASGTVPAARLSAANLEAAIAGAVFGLGGGFLATNDSGIEGDLQVDGNLSVLAPYTLSGDGSGLTALNATQLTSGTVPAARLGEQRILIGSRSFMLETSAVCGWASTVTGNFHSDAIKSASTTLQTFTLGSDPVEVPYGFAAFRTTIAARITWIASDGDSTDAKITGYRLIGYPSPDLTGSPTTLLTASGLSAVVSAADTITKIDIDRSAFSSTTVPRYIVALVDGSIRSNGGAGTTARQMAVMSVEIFSE